MEEELEKAFLLFFYFLFIPEWELRRNIMILQEIKNTRPKKQCVLLQKK